MSKIFRYKKGHICFTTMTVGELREALGWYPQDMPVIAEWEGTHNAVRKEDFSTELVHKGKVEDEAECLVIYVDNH